MLKQILVCIVALDCSFALANDIEVIARSELREQVIQHLTDGEKKQAFDKYQKLALTGDVQSIVGMADLLNDKSYEYYSQKNAYFYYLDAVKKRVIKAYEPLIKILIDESSEFYNLNKASLFASAYLAKEGEGAESLLSYILWKMKSDNQEQIIELALEGYKKKQNRSVLVLAHLYEDGVGVNQDLSESLKYFQKAGLVGFDVEEQLTRIQIKKFSPKVGGLILYGAARDDVTASFIQHKAKILSNKNANIDMFSFENNPNSINSVTNLYSAENKLGALKYVFNADAGRYESLNKVFTNYYGVNTSEKESLVWETPVIRVSLSKVERCNVQCTDNDTQITSFVVVTYQFLNIQLLGNEKRKSNVSAFKF